MMAGTGNAQILSLQYKRSFYEQALSYAYPQSSLITVPNLKGILMVEQPPQLMFNDSGRFLGEMLNSSVLTFRYFMNDYIDQFDVMLTKNDTIANFEIINNKDSLSDQEISTILRRYLYVIQSANLDQNVNYHKEDSLAKLMPTVSYNVEKAQKLQTLIMEKIGSRKIGNAEFEITSHEKILILVQMGYSMDPNPGTPCSYYQNEKKLFDFNLYGLPDGKQISYFITNKSPSITYEEINKILRKWIDSIK